MKRFIISISLLSLCLLANAQKFGGGDGSGYGFVTLTSQPLPVELLHFSGQAIDDYILLTWATASEQNHHSFTLEKSIDGRSFSSIDFIRNNNASGSANTYESQDQQPVKGLNYYRLRQTDNDGSITYSNIIAVNFLDSHSSYSIYPNPTTEYISIDMPSNEREFPIKLTNSQGKVVFQASEIPSSIDFSSLAPGFYYLSFKGQFVKIMKQ